jgi:hypothetical protein
MFDFCRQMLNDHLATWKNMDRFETWQKQSCNRKYWCCRCGFQILA